MKKILIFILTLCALKGFTQVVNNGSGTFVWVDSAPTHNAGASGAKFAVDRNTFKWYEWISGTTWISSGDRIQTISGCAAPAYTPTIHNSYIVVNGCTELYIWNGSAWVLKDADAPTVQTVADSAAMRAYIGEADILIMADVDRGGTFARCETCEADDYMVLRDGNGIYWRRINYDRILSSWWGNFGAVSLQRAIDYVGTDGIDSDSTFGVLTINQEIELRDTVVLKEGVQIHGISPPNIDGSHPADTPAKNAIKVNLSDRTKSAIVWEDNGRAYSINTGIENIAFNVVSDCRAVLDIKEPYKGLLSNIFIGPNTAPRNFDYAILVNGSVVCQWDRLHIQGAKIAGIATYQDVINGTTINIKDSYITRCNIGILDAANVGFWLDNVHPENIDSIFVWTNNGLRLVNSRAENTPLATNGSGAFVYSNGGGEIYMNNLEIGGSTACSLAVNCPVISGGSRQTTLSNSTVISFAQVATTPDAFKFVTLENVRLSSTPMPDSAFLKNAQVQTWNLQLNSGGDLSTSVNYINANLRFNQVIDKDGHTGGNGQVLGKTSGLLDWITPASPISGGTTNTVAKFTSSTTLGNSQITDNGTLVGINTPSPSARLHVTAASGASPFRASTTFGDWTVFSTDGSFRTFSSGLGIYAGSTGGLNMTDGMQINTAGGFTRFYANNTNPIRLINNAVTATSGTHGVAQFYAVGFSPISGNANFSVFDIGGVITQGASATGLVRGGYINATVTGNTSNWRSLEIEPNVGKAIYQTGANAVSNYLGKVAFGSLSAPSQAIHVTGNSQFDGAIMPNGNAGTTGQELVSQGAGVAPVWTTNILKASATLDFPSTNNHENSDLTVTVTGAAIGDGVSLGVGTLAVSAHSCFTAWVSATNTVTVRFNHYGTSGATDPASDTFKVIVHKY